MNCLNPSSFFWNWSRNKRNKITICYRMNLIIAFGSDLFFTLSEIPKMSPAYLTKYSISFS